MLDALTSASARRVAVGAAVRASAPPPPRAHRAAAAARSLIGATIGSVGVWMSGRLLEGLVAGLDARDGATFVIAVAVLLGVAVVSSWMPARWAAATDPMATLRAE